MQNKTAFLNAAVCFAFFQKKVVKLAIANVLLSQMHIEIGNKQAKNKCAFVKN